MALLACASALACARAPVKASGATQPSPVVWPEPPSPPRVRLAVVVSEGTNAAPARSWWRRAFGVITGEVAVDRPRTALERPFDVSVDETGAFAVADPDSRRVLRYDAKGNFAGDALCPGREWSAPMGVVAMPGGELIVVDSGAASIVRWTLHGCRVVCETGLLRPVGVAARGDRIVVADPPAHQVVALSGTGEVLGRWGQRGDGPGQFQFPTDVALDADGSMFVVDSLNFRIAHLDRDGRWLGAFGDLGEQDGGLARPKGIDLDASGLVYVTDAQRDVVVVTRRDGALEYLLGAPGAEPGRLAHPAGIAASGSRVAIADSLNGRVQVFETVGARP